MEHVKSFNNELSSLYEVKPPISKAKMTAITRGAIKAIKFYKHVVQSVEKFILKCKPEYKVPGLYVIDSIVRQSRHQFGTDKDVFAPRFAKNMQQTFVNLFKCPPEDKSKIIRVLNLWQKNQVFAPEVVQPLFDLADPNNPIHKELSQQSGTPVQSNGLNISGGNIIKGSPALQKTPTKGTLQGNESTHHGSTNLNLSDPNVLAQLQQLQRLLNRETKPEGPPVHFDRKLLDFDYGDEEEEVNPSPKPNPNDSVASLLTNPEVLRQLQTLQQSLIAGQAAEMDVDKMRKLQEMKQQEDEFDKHLAQTVPNLPFASECEFKPSTQNVGNAMGNNNYYMPSGPDMSFPPPGYGMNQSQVMDADVEFLGGMNTNVNQDRNDGGDIEVITLDQGDSQSSSPREDRFSRRRRSNSRERSRDRRDKGDRDRDRRSRRSRSRSRSRSRKHRSRSRDRERERKDKERETEKDKERKKRGLPPIKKENLSVCSTTLWVGHLSKLVHQEDLSDTFGEFGEIISIDLIPPRGCAFIVMNRRQDAARCLAKLKNHVLHGKALTLAWAPGKGVKGKDFKDYWEGDLGVSYIPWSKLKPDIDVEMLEDGGMLDEDTIPGWMKTKIQQNAKNVNNISANDNSIPSLQTVVPPTVDTSQPPPIPNAGLLQPPPHMSMPLVPPPFQLNRGLLGPPVGMNLPPGMMPNVPIGVPPPNLTGPMMPIGIGSPFQGPPNLLPPPHLQMPNSDKSSMVTSTPNTMKTLSESLMKVVSQPFGAPLQQSGGLPPVPQEDNMDIEMEDADGKIDRPAHSNDRMGISNRDSDPRMNLNSEDSRGRRDDRDRRSRDRDRDREHGSRDRERNRRGSRDRDRDRNDREGKDYRDNFDRDGRSARDREMRGRENRRDFRDGRDPYNRDRDNRDGRDHDRNRDRGRDTSRGRDRRDSRRDRDNRWGDRQERDFSSGSKDDRRERERALNERLQEMANNKGDRRSQQRERKDSNSVSQACSVDKPSLEVPSISNEWPPTGEYESHRDGPLRADMSRDSNSSHGGALLDTSHNPVIEESPNVDGSHGVCGQLDAPHMGPMDRPPPLDVPMDSSHHMEGPHGFIDGHRGPMDGPLGPMDGSRGLLNGPRGPIEGHHGLMDEPHCPIDGLRGPIDGPRGPIDGSYGRGEMDGPFGHMDMPRGQRMDGPMIDGPHGPMMMDGPMIESPHGPLMEGPHGPMLEGPLGPMMEDSRDPMMEGFHGPVMQGPRGPVMQGPHGPMMEGPHGPMMEGPHGPMMEGPHGPMMEGPHGSMLDGPFGPPMMDGPPHRMRNDRFMRGGRRNFRDFGPRMRGPGPDFFPPRDAFGPRGPPKMRGGPDFRPRMMRPPFHPRGGPRGPRPGFPWKDRNFPPRFEAPQDCFEGPPIFEGLPQDRFEGPPEFDNPPRHRGRHFDRRNNNYNDDGPPGHEDAPPGRRSRWGNFDEEQREYEWKQQQHELQKANIEQGDIDGKDNDGNTTPLRDEPGMAEASSKEADHENTEISGELLWQEPKDEHPPGCEESEVAQPEVEVKENAE